MIEETDLLLNKAFQNLSLERSCNFVTSGLVIVRVETVDDMSAVTCENTEKYLQADHKIDDGQNQEPKGPSVDSWIDGYVTQAVNGSSSHPPCERI